MPYLVMQETEKLINQLINWLKPSVFGTNSRKTRALWRNYWNKIDLTTDISNEATENEKREGSC